MLGLPWLLPCSLAFSSQLPRGPYAPCGMAGVQWEGRGIGKGLCGMLLPLPCSSEMPRRQRGYTPVSVCSPHQV